MSHKIIDECGLSRISMAISQLRELKNKSISKWADAIESSLSNGIDLHGEQVEIIINQLDNGDYDTSMEESEAKRMICELEPLSY